MSKKSDKSANPLDKIFTIELTVDEGCAVLAAIDAAVIENEKWCNKHKIHPSKQDVVLMNKLLHGVHNNLIISMEMPVDD